MFSRSPNSGSPRFKLPVVVLRHSWWKNSSSPMLHLSGGPGGAAYLERKSINFHIQNFISQDWGVDFVLYDQRGNGLSKPELQCERANNHKLRSLALDLSSRDEYVGFIGDMQTCLEDLNTYSRYSGHLKYISTDHSVGDIADLHDLLGVDQWVLMGVSYGTRLALESARQIPNKIKSMVLDSVYPPQVDGFEVMTENDLNTIQNVLNLCEKDSRCNDSYPELDKHLAVSLVSLKKEAWLLNVLYQEKSGSGLRELSLTAGRFIRLLSYASYDSSLFKDIPAAIIAVGNRNKRSMSINRLSENFLKVETFEDFSIPVFMTIECLENAGFDTQKLSQKLQTYQSKYPMLDLSLGSVYDPKICEGWRQLSLSKVRDFRAPVSTDIPSLVLAGGLDSVTPVRWARAVLDDLTHSVYIEYPNAAHGVLHSSLCANDEVQRFLNPKQQVTSFCSAKKRLAERIGVPMEWTY